MKQYKSALLFGTFDPLHYGHIQLIKNALKLCETLYICIDSNELIRLKGREPSLSIIERKENMAMFKGVSFVGVESLAFPKKYWIDLLKPEVLIKGDDWVGKNWSGEKLLKTIYIPHTKGIHSSDIWRGNI